MSVDAVMHTKKNPSWQLFAILLVTLIPMMAAYVAYFTGMGVPQDTVNEGILLEPARNMKDILGEAEGQLPTLKNNLKWTLLIPVGQNCDANCQKNLYITRQVHIRLAEKADRIERYAVNLNGQTGLDYLNSIASDQPGLKSFSVSRTVWDKWLSGTNAPASVENQHYFILVDQVGYAMMFYSIDHDGNQLLKDIKRVLRFSPGG